MDNNGQKSFLVSLLGGGVAGTSVDVALFPLDTVKTRLQASEGFFKAGGFRGIYAGISAAAAGSAPGAALFFSSYEVGKRKLSNYADGPVVHMGAASIGETAACLVRVPTEIVKQRMQTGMYSSMSNALQSIYKTNGFLGFYQGYFSMLAREIPFSLIQFPLWEGLKRTWGKKQGGEVSSLQGALCGSISGSFAAAITTPLDVVKTRLMLGKDAQGRVYTTAMDTLQRIYKEEGGKKLFSGIGPRTMWIGIGGFVFFGMYEKSTQVLCHHL